MKLPREGWGQSTETWTVEWRSFDLVAGGPACSQCGVPRMWVYAGKGRRMVSCGTGQGGISEPAHSHLAMGYPVRRPSSEYRGIPKHS